MITFEHLHFPENVFEQIHQVSLARFIGGGKTPLEFIHLPLEPILPRLNFCPAEYICRILLQPDVLPAEIQQSLLLYNDEQALQIWEKFRPRDRRPALAVQARIENFRKYKPGDALETSRLESAHEGSRQAARTLYSEEIEIRSQERYRTGRMTTHSLGVTGLIARCQAARFAGWSVTRNSIRNALRDLALARSHYSLTHGIDRLIERKGPARMQTNQELGTLTKQALESRKKTWREFQGIIYAFIHEYYEGRS